MEHFEKVDSSPKTYAGTTSMEMVTNVPTVHRFSEHLLHRLVASKDGMGSVTPDRTQACNESEPPFERNLYISAQAIMDLPQTPL